MIRTRTAPLAAAAVLTLALAGCAGSKAVDSAAGGGLGGSTGGNAAGGPAPAPAPPGQIVVTTKIYGCHIDFGENFDTAHPVLAGGQKLKGTVSFDCEAPINGQHVTVSLFTDHGRGGTMPGTPVATQLFDQPSQQQQVLRVYTNCYPGRWRVAYSGTITVADAQPAQIGNVSDSIDITQAQCNGAMG